MRIKLPIIDNRKKWPAAAAWYLLFCVVYLFTGNIHILAPIELKQLFPDRETPFVSWTVWIYFSQYALLLFCAFAVKTSQAISRMFWSISLASLISFIIFLVFPTTFPRPALREDDGQRAVYALLYSVDSAANCFPSLHVSVSCLAALSLWDEKKWIGAFAVGWAAAIAISTLTTKQHYFLDLIGAAPLIFICRRLIDRCDFN